MFSHAPVALVKCGTVISVKSLQSKYFLAPRSRLASILAIACISGVAKSSNLLVAVASFSKFLSEGNGLWNTFSRAQIGSCKAQAKRLCGFGL